MKQPNKSKQFTFIFPQGIYSSILTRFLQESYNKFYKISIVYGFKSLPNNLACTKNFSKIMMNFINISYAILDKIRSWLLSALVTEFGKLAVVVIPYISDNEFLIKVEASPKNPSDLKFIAGTYSLESPGNEGSGLWLNSEGAHLILNESNNVLTINLGIQLKI